MACVAFADWRRPSRRACREFSPDASEPEFAGGAGGVADILIDELFVPRLADAEGVHGADLHVRHHLRRRHDDGRDVLVRIDAAGGEPVANPQIMGAAGERHGDLHFLAGCFLLREGFLQRRAVGSDRQILELVGDRDGLAVLVEVEERVHRQRLIVLHHLAGGVEMRLRAQDVAAIDTVGLCAERHVVARRAPRRLLGDIHVGHAVLGVKALLFRDDQRRGVGQRDCSRAWCPSLQALRPGRRRPTEKRRPQRSSARRSRPASEDAGALHQFAR